MSDLAKLQSDILSQIAGAGDEAALESVRVAALGKKGSISALLATLGKMSPDERKTAGAKIKSADGAKDVGRVTSVVASPRLGRTVGLGLVRYEHLAAGTELKVFDDSEERSQTARVEGLPLVRGGWYADEGKE